MTSESTDANAPSPELSATTSENQVGSSTERSADVAPCIGAIVAALVAWTTVGFITQDDVLAVVYGIVVGSLLTFGGLLLGALYGERNAR